MKSTRKSCPDKPTTSSSVRQTERTRAVTRKSVSKSRQAGDEREDRAERTVAAATTSATVVRREDKSTLGASKSNLKEPTATSGGGRGKGDSKEAASNVIDTNQSLNTNTMERQRKQQKQQQQRRQQQQQASSSGESMTFSVKERQQLFRASKSREQCEDKSSSSQEMTTTSASDASLLRSEVTLTPMQGGNIEALEQESNLGGNDGHKHGGDTDDDERSTLLETPKSSPMNANESAPQTSSSCRGDPPTSASWIDARGSSSEEPELVLYHDDEEINCQWNHPSTSASRDKNALGLRPTRRLSGDNEEDYYQENDELSNGAALTMADDDQLTTLHSEIVTVVVYPLGSCEFDETQLVSNTSTRAIQKCILRLSNRPSREEAMCWGLGQSTPIVLQLFDDYLKFTDIESHSHIRSVPYNTIKSWAVDDDNNFAFVIEENQQQQQQQHQGEAASTSSTTTMTADTQAADYALLNGPSFMCFAFRSYDDDDMSCRVAAKLNAEITRYRDQLASQVSKSTKLKQMIVVDPRQASSVNHIQEDQQTDLDADDLDELDQLDSADELSLGVKYIGSVQVPQPMGIDVLNYAIDKCLAEASNRSIVNASHESASASTSNSANNLAASSSNYSPLTNAKLHVSPSSVIVENVETGAIIVECRIRFLTFMGISRRDIRWCGFIMQNPTNKTFEAHCVECHPTAGHVCDAIQASCSRMYERMLRGQKTKRQQQEDATTSILPNGSRLRDTLAKTLSKIKLTPIIGSGLPTLG